MKVLKKFFLLFLLVALINVMFSAFRTEVFAAKATAAVLQPGTIPVARPVTIQATSNADRFIEKLEKRLSKINNKWKYSQSPKWSKKTTNCSVPVSYALQDMKVLKGGEFVYINRENVIHNEKKLQKGGLKKFSGKGKTARTLIAEGLLKKGDIVFWKGNTHTSVYAGNGKFYDCGKTATTNSKKAGGRYIPSKLKPRKTNTKHVVYRYYRFKD